ncbi:hypothetical protein ABZ897_60385 [Nonomuraea sp. NPDC046802]|uniref:hypothetical protein n=1 Tax=Nonomuraea sp. NPDC046802 TaxID=3154919 RepID=UPI0033DEBF47
MSHGKFRDLSEVVLGDYISIQPSRDEPARWFELRAKVGSENPTGDNLVRLLTDSEVHAIAGPADKVMSLEAAEARALIEQHGELPAPGAH